MTSRNYCWTLNNYTDEEYDYLVSKELVDELNYHIVAKEVGESGTPHLQGYTVFKNSLRMTGAKKLFRSNKIHLEHRKGTHEEASDYCKKTNEYKEFGNVQEHAKRKTASAWSLVHEATSYDDACSILEIGSPRDWFIQGESIRSNLKRKFTEAFPSYDSKYTDFNVPKELTDWINSWEEERTKCLFLIGPSRYGKTTWARSIIQPHTYWKMQIDLTTYNPESKLVIFDDVDWKLLSYSAKGWLTQAGEFTATDKYHRKKIIHATFPAIYITNEWPVWSSPQEQEYWKVNGEFVEISNKLF